MAMSLAEFRALLGRAAARLTDAQVEAQRDAYYGLARSVVGLYHASRRPVGEVTLQRVDQPRRPRRARALRRPA